MSKKRTDFPKSYRWNQEDRDLIDRLRAQWKGPTGEPCPEIDILRAALRLLAHKSGVAAKNI